VVPNTFADLISWTAIGARTHRESQTPPGGCLGTVPMRSASRTHRWPALLHSDFNAMKRLPTPISFPLHRSAGHARLVHAPEP